MTLYGYARVSTRDQDLAGQVAELTAAGCAKVYRETASGAKADRAELAKVLARLRYLREVQASAPSATHGQIRPPHTAGSC